MDPVHDGEIVVETARMRLRPFSVLDADAWHDAIFADTEVTRYLPSDAQRTREQTREAAGKKKKRWIENGIDYWAAERLSDGALLGHCGLSRLDTGEIEVLYGFGRAHWGSGYATEGCIASIRFGFEQQGYDRIVALCVPENSGSQNVMRKAGLKLVREGEYFGLHVLVHEIRREEWKRVDAPYRVIHRVIRDPG
ncbi:MAG: GNAT family N-acetyltransferase [Actinomycetota bacterium]